MLLAGDPCPDCPNVVAATDAGGVRCATCWFTQGPRAQGLDFRTSGQRVLGPLLGVIWFAIAALVWGALALVGAPLVLALVLFGLVLAAGAGLLVRVLR